MNTLFAIGVGAYAATTIAYLASLWTARPVAAQLAVWLLSATLLYQAALID